ncbi:MAG: hypothetical protein Q8O46_04340 [bacterium]|nr:hypothetical protein [bacterium]
MKSTEVRTKILEMLPVYQQDAWRKLGLEHRQISDVVRGLEAEGLLIRKKYKCTFFLETTLAGKKERKKLVPVKKPVPEKKLVPLKIVKKEPRFSPLISNGFFSPCTGCSTPECEPPICGKLLVWLQTV